MMNSTLTVLFLLLVAAASAQLDAAQQAALFAVYDGLGCNATVCPRFAEGAVCVGSAKLVLDCVGGRVTRLDVPSALLAGSLVTALGVLSGLRDLAVDFNELVGTLPTAIWSTLTVLTNLDLKGNNLVGVVPTQMALMTALREFEIYKNDFTHLPDVFASMTALTELRVEENDLTSALPSSLRLLSRLTNLDFADNLVFGQISVHPAVAFLRTCNFLRTCVDCATIPFSNCSCSASSRCPITATTAATTMAPATTAASTTATAAATSTTQTTTTAESTSTATSATPAATTLLPSTSASTASSGNTTSAAVATSPAASDVPVIAGAVGGSLALLLIAGLIVAFVCRKRAHEPTHELPSIDGTPPLSPQQRQQQTYTYGNLNAVVPPYSNIPASETTHYSDLVVAPEVSTYDKVAVASEYTELKV